MKNAGSADGPGAAAITSRFTLRGGRRARTEPSGGVRDGDVCGGAGAGGGKQ